MFHSRIYHVLCVSVSFFSSFSNIFLLVSIIHSKAKSEMSLNLSLKQKSCSKKSQEIVNKKTFRISIRDLFVFLQPFSTWPEFNTNLTEAFDNQEVIWVKPLCLVHGAYYYNSVHKSSTKAMSEVSVKMCLSRVRLSR